MAIVTPVLPGSKALLPLAPEEEEAAAAAAAAAAADAADDAAAAAAAACDAESALTHPTRAAAQMTMASNWTWWPADRRARGDDAVNRQLPRLIVLLLVVLLLLVLLLLLLMSPTPTPPLPATYAVNVAARRVSFPMAAAASAGARSLSAAGRCAGCCR